MKVAEEAAEVLAKFGVRSEGALVSYSPIDGSEIGRVRIREPAAARAHAAAGSPTRTRPISLPSIGE